MLLHTARSKFREAMARDRLRRAAQAYAEARERADKALSELQDATQDFENRGKKHA